MDAICECPESKALLRSAMLEIVHVAGESGFTLTDKPEEYVDDILENFGKMKASTTSTSRDVIMGRPSEIQALSGAMCGPPSARASEHRRTTLSLRPCCLRN